METYYWYFDESGNLGKSNRYFVIASILTKEPKALHNKMKKVLKYIKKNYDNLVWNGVELKANSCKGEVRAHIYDAIVSKDVKISYIVVDKHNLTKNFLEDKNRAYNYFLKVLLDKYHDIFRDNNVYLKLDNRSIKVKSLNSFNDYINIHINLELQLNCNLNVEYLESNSKAAYNIQAADFIANAIFAKYEYGNSKYYDMFAEKVDIYQKFPYKKFGIDVGDIIEQEAAIAEQEAAATKK